MLALLIPLWGGVEVVAACVGFVALLGFGGLALAASAVGLTVSTPLFIMFSPIILPATITTIILATGFTASGSLALTAAAVLIWILRHRAGVKPADNPLPIGKPPAPSEGAAAGESQPTVSGGYGGSWGGKPFSGTISGFSIPGLFGGKPAAEKKPAEGKPAAEKKPAEGKPAAEKKPAEDKPAT